MINQQLAEISNLSIVVAITLYVLALFGFSMDLARISQRKGDARLEAKERELVSVGAGEKASSGSGTVAASAEAVAAQDEAAESRGGMTPLRFGFIMATVAAVLHAVGVIMRGIATARAPWANMYEFAMTSTAVVMIAFLLFAIRRRDIRTLGTFVVGPVLTVMLLAQTIWIVPAAELTPSLRNSHWLYIHIGVAIAATALSLLGAVIAGLQLAQARREREVAAGTTDAWGPVGRIFARIPSSAQLESLSFRIHAFTFVCWTFTLIFGAIWAREAWGRAWGWDPKEVWTLVIWVLYAAYLHARNTAKFRGSRAAWIALLGFLAVVFNYTIVNTVINGLHSYSGL